MTTIPTPAKICLVVSTLLGIAGCATQKAQRPPDFLLSECRRGIEDGSVYAGQWVREFEKQYVQVRISEVGDLKLYTYSRLPGFEGLTIVAKDGRLVRAFDWTDAGTRRVYFDSMTDADRRMLNERF